MSDYYLQPSALGLPAGMPGLRHNYQADGRHVFAAETEEYRIWVEPKPVAWSKPGLYALEPPTMPTDGPKPSDAGHFTATKPANFGVNMQGLKPHANRVETNDPNFFPSLQTNLSAAAGQQVPLPLGGDGPAQNYGNIAIGAIAVVLVLAFLMPAVLRKPPSERH